MSATISQVAPAANTQGMVPLKDSQGYYYSSVGGFRDYHAVAGDPRGTVVGATGAIWRGIDGSTGLLLLKNTNGTSGGWTAL